MKTVIKSIWELPQNALGFIVKKVCKATHLITYRKDAIVYSWRGSAGMSLGKYIFVPFTSEDFVPLGPYFIMSDNMSRYVRHEYGHTIQSKYLGWFYLLIIGLPSLIWSQCFEWYRRKTGKDYYDFYTEKWADKLGGVER